VKKLFLIFLLASFLFFIFICCDEENSNTDNGDDNNNDDNEDIPAELLSASDFQYLGAFRLPNGPSDIRSFLYGGQSMTYYPDGDPNGPDDGFPGSLYISGHAWEHQVAEINIPAPVQSNAKDRSQLNTAGILQNFTTIMNVANLEIPRTGFAFLRRQGSQSADKLHFCWGYHMQDENEDLTHGWCELNLSNPDTKQGWYLAGHSMHIRNMSTNDYMFEIPGNWANTYVSGRRLATGRFRDGGWSGMGPVIFAIAPWEHGNPPSNNTGINNTTLLLYTSTMDAEDGFKMDNYHHSDEWSGAEWLTAGDKAAVIFVGTKGTGDCWYGNENGPCLSCDNRGWWSTGFEAQIVFYDPSDLASVAQGELQPYEPQPYTTMDIEERFFNVTSTQQKEQTGAIAFDRENSLLYVIEYRADSDKPLIHVWRING